MYRDEALNERISRFFELAAKAVISVVVVAIFVTILAGTAYTVYDFRLIFSEPFHEAFRTILIDILTVLAIMEILRTALAYYSYGRVKVTYIIDAVLVTTLTEILAFWYQGHPVAETVHGAGAGAFARFCQNYRHPLFPDEGKGIFIGWRRTSPQSSTVLPGELS